MEGKIRRITQKQINLEEVDSENILYVKHGKKWVNEPAALISADYLEYRKGIDDTKKMQLFVAKSVIDNDFPGLTKRECEVILLYIQGYTQQQIADIFHLAKGTVQQYLKRARKKLKKLIPEFKEDI